MSQLFITELIILGIFGDTFGELFSFLGDIVGSIASVIWDAISWIGNLIWDAITWLGELLRDIFQFLIDLLISFFEVIYALIDGFFYFLYNIGLLAVKVFMIFFEVGRLIISFIQGITATLQSLFFTPGSTGGHGYSGMLGQIFAALEVFQLNVIAYVLLFIIWISTAFTVVRILSNLRGAGGS
ncbi:hypothetical protein [Alkalibacillus silvisoli]|uniref:Uncharacterized protein n=1 Tax=Alkalibacillus silvisoli TaxID=392823 RepID=A0ABP3K7U1_9BACI